MIIQEAWLPGYEKHILRKCWPPFRKFESQNFPATLNGAFVSLKLFFYVGHFITGVQYYLISFSQDFTNLVSILFILCRMFSCQTNYDSNFRLRRILIYTYHDFHLYMKIRFVVDHDAYYKQK